MIGVEHERCCLYAAWMMGTCGRVFVVVPASLPLYTCDLGQLSFLFFITGLRDQKQGRSSVPLARCSLTAYTLGYYFKVYHAMTADLYTRSHPSCQGKRRDGLREWKQPKIETKRREQLLQGG